MTTQNAKGMQAVKLDNAAAFSHSTGFNMSEQYRAIDTGYVLDLMQSLGYELSGFSKARVKNAAKNGFQKHLLRFRRPDVKALSVGDTVPEIVIKNSYDGTTALHVYCGLYRLICANGAMVGETYGHYRILHRYDNTNKLVADAVAAIEGKISSLNSTLEGMQKLQLDAVAQRSLASFAAQLVLPESTISANVDDMLIVRRDGDRDNDLWTVYNRIQETALRGGLRYTSLCTSSDGAETVRNNTTRAIKSVARIVDVNVQLFNAAESVLKAA